MSDQCSLRNLQVVAHINTPGVRCPGGSFLKENIMIGTEQQPMDMSEMPAPASAGLTSTVPLSALAVPGEDEMLVNPEQGNKVNYTVDGIIESIQGEMAVVKILAINGDEVEQPKATFDELDSLRGDAEQIGVM